MATPAFKGTPGTFGVAAATSIVLTKPASVANGDLIIVGIRAQGTVATEVTMPTGFARAGSAQGAADRAQGFFYKYVTDAGSEPANYTFGGWSSGRADGYIDLITNIDPADIIGGFPPFSTGDLAAYSTDSVPLLTLAMWGDERTSPRSHVPTTTPSGYTTRANFQNTLDSSTTGSRTAVWIGSRAVADGGSPSIPAAALVWPDGVSANRAVGVTLRGVSTPVAPPRGFDSVGQAISTKGATWAHRGGSADWPEMSQYAYEQAAARGYGVLEFQSQRTSDGWWFGLHDNNFDRTSLVTGSPAPATLTQAQVLSTYQNLLNAGGTPRPYWGLIDFLDTWTPTHVVVVDPKNQLGFTTEFLNLLDAHGGPDKIIVKYSGVGSGSAALADAAKARGYETWGYFYEPDVADGDVATWQSHWTTLGMEWGASQATWDAMLAYGKPVFAHIAATQTGYNTGMDHGAQGVQVSGVSAVAAVSRSERPAQPFDRIKMGTKFIDKLYVGGTQIWP